jgi:hypothetical protein
MTYIQTFVILSTVFFVTLTITLSSNNGLSVLLKIGCALMAIFGVVMSLSSLGLVLANGVKLV